MRHGRQNRRLPLPLQPSFAILSSDLQGTARLVVTATTAVTDVVEHMHRNIAWPASLLGRAPTGPTRGITGLVYRSIRQVTGLVGETLDLALQAAAPLIDRQARERPADFRDGWIAALNGVVGDNLADTANPLAIAMEFRRDGRTLTQHPGGPMLLLIHGLCMHDGQWRRDGHDHGAALAAEFGYAPVYLRYNSGRHVSSNGRDLALQLEALVQNAATPVSGLSILGFSMGGLLARSACHYAALAGHRWPRLLQQLVFLGTPHQGAPLERGGNGLHRALGISPYSAPLARLGRLRSAGITDLRHGNLLDEDWDGIDRFDGDGRRPQMIPLPRDVDCVALGATIGRCDGDLVDQLCGDGLVPLASALGGGGLEFAPDKRWIGYGIHHLDLLSRPEVYSALRGFMRRSNAASTPSLPPPPTGVSA